VRVVLIDGLRLDRARTLPHLDEVCAGGWDLVVDVGFPTLSLPVQSVLWTGLSQAQVGVVTNNDRLETPPPGSYPARVPGSRAVAEAYPRLIHSFGFGRAEPARDAGDHPAAPWPASFPTAAAAAVGSDAPLVFIPLLGVDEAGHAHGARSAEYRNAAARADEQLGALWALRRPDDRWFVLADHGHRDRGGHGDVEPDVRFVRGCLAGALPPGPPAERRVHLVDFSRALGQSLGLPPPSAAADREPPRPRATQWVFAGLIFGAGLLGCGTRWRLWPFWASLGYTLFALFFGPPSLSNPLVKHPLSWKVLAVFAPALALLALHTHAVLRSRIRASRAAARLLGLPIAAFLASAGLSWGSPPMMPWWTGRAALLGALCVYGAVTFSLVLGLSRWSSNRPTASTSRSSDPNTATS
jgi:hypothetical protein